MPRIPDEYLYCTIYLYESSHAAESGTKSGGTGFLVGIPSAVSGNHIYAVTNRHVVERGNSPVIRLNSVDGGIATLDLVKSDWEYHDEWGDLAICSIGLTPQHLTTAISLPTLIAEQDIPTLEIGPGDDTFMIGRFMNHEGMQRNFPSVRFGNIAMMPWEPVYFGKSVDGKDVYQEGFLVETRSIGGFSGSPVFVYIKPYSSLFKIDVPIRNEHQTWVRLLGIDCGHVPSSEYVKDKDGNKTPDAWRVNYNSGMAIVIPAWHLAGILNSDEYVTARIKVDQQKLQQDKTDGAAVQDADDLREDFYRAIHQVSRPDQEPPDEG